MILTKKRPKMDFMKDMMMRYDEPVLNTMMILFSSLGIKYIDENISCKRLDIVDTKSYRTFYSLINSCQDFVRASYGNDTGCVQWSNATKLVFASHNNIGTSISN